MSVEITNGFLPAAAFRHLEPTALGSVDIEPPARVEMFGGPPARYADALLLARLHGDPLGLVHAPSVHLATRRDDLLAFVTAQLGQRIRDHELRFGCCREDGRCQSSLAPPLPGRAAVIVPTGGRPQQLDRCLSSLARAVQRDTELIVVDNRPAADGTRQLVSRWSERDDRVRYVAEKRPGSSVARNRGLIETDAELVAFTDDDVVVDEAWLRWLLAPFADAAVTAATGLVLPLELSTVAQKRFEQYAGFSKGVTRRSYDLGAHSSHDRLLYPYWGGVFGSGNSMAFRRAELVAAGGFDPALGAGSVALSGADIEAMSAAILRGGQLVYEPRSLCWHEHRRDDEALRRQLFNYGAGFTAILTKALVRDRRFPYAVARSGRVALRARRRRAAADDGGSNASLPMELVQLQRKGMLKGPVLYARSVRWAKRHRLHEVIDGR